MSALLLLVINSCNGKSSSKTNETIDTLKSKKDSVEKVKPIELKDTILAFQGIKIGMPAKEVNTIIRNNKNALPSSDDYVRYMYSIHPFSYFDCEKIHKLVCFLYYKQKLAEYYTIIKTTEDEFLGRVGIYTDNDTVRTIRITFPCCYDEIKKLIQNSYGKEYTEFSSVKDFKAQKFSTKKKEFENHEGSIWLFKHHRIVLADHWYNKKTLNEYQKQYIDEDELAENSGIELVYEDYDYYLDMIKLEQKIEKEIKAEEARERKKRLEEVNNQGL